MDGLYQEVLQAGEDAARQRAVLASGPDPLVLFAVLRRAVPVRLLELVAATPPWSDDRRLLAGVALHPKTPRPLALRVLDSLFWRDLLDVSLSTRVAWPVRQRAEALLVERIDDLRVGERVALARLAPPRALVRLLEDADARALEAALANPRLREEDLVAQVRKDTVARALIEAAAASPRWRESYALRLAIVLQPRSPLGVALAQLTSLLPRDLERVGADEAVPPLVQRAAQRARHGPAE